MIVLCKNGYIVGFLGDGINDVLVMKVVDIGIFVDIVVDIVKELVDVIFLEKDLMILERGFFFGREIFGNIMKYIKVIVSFNFGNMFFVLIVSMFLLFLLMLFL